ncbi:MAG: threonine synthase [Lentisphaerae bacterium]|nr:threonine synthase [Lentisphaerota bacterium]
MRYVSTRGGVEAVSFSEAVLMGMAADGGLLVPEGVPEVADRLDAWRGLSYADLAFEVLALFADLPADDLRGIIRRGYATFDHPEIAPVVRVGDLYVQELFHGPTLAFKDIALQLLGNLFEYALRQRGGRLNILGATSGDTGSAAIHGVRGRERMRIFVMHPRGRVSRTQELQMTSVLDDNVFNLAVDGSFDDCQAVMKEIFADADFKRRYALGAVNSINWARLAAQIVYYFYAAFRVTERTGAARVRFAVPTGNFGDIFAGYMAARMGLPVSRLVLATNTNDILARFFNTGVYSRGGVVRTVSPSMDIQVASNFERYLYYRFGADAAAVRRAMRQFASTGSLRVPCADGRPVDPLFAAGAAGDEEALAVIRETHAAHGYLADPHTAVGMRVASLFTDAAEPMICLATAHPAKFGEAVNKATGRDIARHPLIDGLAGMPTRCEVLPPRADLVRAYIRDHVPETETGR